MFLYLTLSFYVAIGNLGTKVLENIIILSVFICKKVSIYKAFYSIRSFDNTKSNTIFIANQIKKYVFC